MDYKIALIILNWNGKKDTLECLSSVAKIQTPNLEVVVIDNGSTDGSAEAIREQFAKVTVIEAKKNYGFAEGNNIGMRYALAKGADFVFLLNNDTIVDPLVVDHFLVQMRADPSIGILGGKIFLYDEPQKLDHLGGCWNPKKRAFDFVGLREEDRGQEQLPMDYVCGAALFIRASLLKAIGLFDARFFLIWEEADFCFRARRSGFKVLSSEKAKIWHKVSASFVGGKPHSTYFWWRNRLLWIERNFQGAERLMLWLKILFLEVVPVYKRRALKTLQLFLYRLISKKELEGREERLLRYEACLQGVKDYLLRRFGDGPAWIYRRKR